MVMTNVAPNQAVIHDFATVILATERCQNWINLLYKQYKWLEESEIKPVVLNRSIHPKDLRIVVETKEKVQVNIPALVYWWWKQATPEDMEPLVPMNLLYEFGRAMMANTATMVMMVERSRNIKKT